MRIIALKPNTLVAARRKPRIGLAVRRRGDRGRCRTPCEHEERGNRRANVHRRIFTGFTVMSTVLGGPSGGSICCEVGGIAALIRHRSQLALEVSTLISAVDVLGALDDQLQRVLESLGRLDPL